MITIRWLVSIALAAFITLILFYFMQTLIATGSQITQNSTVIPVVDATMPEIVMEVHREIEKPEPLEELNEPPPPPVRSISIGEGPGIPLPRTAINTGIGIDISSIDINVTDGAMLPLVNVAPQYPTRAASRGIEGWAQVRFTVTETGNVRDVEVIDSEPPGIFDSSSIKAAEQFRFQPRIVNGEGVAVPGIQYIFRYTLER